VNSKRAKNVLMQMELRVAQASATGVLLCRCVFPPRMWRFNALVVSVEQYYLEMPAFAQRYDLPFFSRIF